MHRLIARLLLGVGVVATSAVALPPAPNSDRVDTTNVDWDQIPLTQADELDLILNADFRVADVDFYPSDSLKNPESTGSYMGISYQNIGRYAAAEGAIVRYGPGDPSDVLRDLRDDDFRPIDIEYAVTLERVQGGDFVPIERLTAFAVSNTRSRQADWLSRFRIRVVGKRTGKCCSISRRRILQDSRARCSAHHCVRSTSSPWILGRIHPIDGSSCSRSRTRSTARQDKRAGSSGSG